MVLLFSCATKTPKTDALVKAEVSPVSHLIVGVPFIEQADNHCGPSSLAMILSYKNHPVTLETLTSQMYTPEKKGSFKTDLINTVRRQGLLAVEVKELKNMLSEIATDHPVLVFQNLGFNWYPNWHFAVAIGYDLAVPEMILHSGKNKQDTMDMRLFERSWSLGDHWSVVILKPGELSQTGNDLEHVAAISGLEQVGKLKEAHLSYQAVLKKWPQSLPGHIGMANVHYTEKKYKLSVKVLKEALKFHPTHSMLWHNLATAQGASGDIKEAKKSTQECLRFALPNQENLYRESLKNYL